MPASPPISPNESPSIARGRGSVFRRRYNLVRLVHVEPFELITDAIAREKAVKAWKREWKITLIESANPEWRNLFDELHLA